MKRRTTIEIEDDLLQRAKRALGATTTRAAVEESLRQVAERAEADGEARASRQRAFLEGLPLHVDLKILGSEQMWQ